LKSINIERLRSVYNPTRLARLLARPDVSEEWLEKIVENVYSGKAFYLEDVLFEDTVQTKLKVAISCTLAGGTCEFRETKEEQRV